MLRALGFGYVSNETLLSVLIVVGIVAMFCAWICDAVMRDSGFGVIANTVVLFSGSIGGLVGWQVWVEPVLGTDPIVLLTICIGGGFGLLMLLAILKRHAP